MKTKRRPPTSTKRARLLRRNVKIFISHSTRDASLVELIVDLLKASDLHEEEIRCTSVHRHGLPIGAKIADVLRSDIEECEIIIAVLTKDALDSLNVLLELGAGWGLDKRLVPITGPGIHLEGLPQWLSEKHGMRWDHKECWEDFDRDVFRPLGKTIKFKKRFRGAIEKLIKWQPIES